MRLELTRVLARATGTVAIHGRLRADHGDDAVPPSRSQISARLTGPDGTVVAQQALLVESDPIDPGIVTGRLTVERPEPWWPRALGVPALHRLDVVLDDEDGSDVLTRHVGFRAVSRDHGVFSINGRRMFLKGSALEGVTSPELMERASSIGLDLVHLIGAWPSIDRTQLEVALDAADRLGLVVAAELPTDDRVERDQLIDSLSHHPSLLVWTSPPNAATPRARRPLRRWRRGQDPDVAPVHVPEDDDTRVVTTFAPPVRLGWEDGDERSLPRRLQDDRRAAEFLTGFGAPAAGPDSADAAARHATGQHVPCFATHTPPRLIADPAEWAAATRNYQAMVTRFAVESVRVIKYRPAEGFVHHVLASSEQAAAVEDPSLLSATGEREAVTALTDVCRPVLAVADRIPPHLHGGERLTIGVHLVNDLRVAIVDAVIVLNVRWNGGGTEYRYDAACGPDDVVEVAVVDLDVPTVSGPYELDLTLIQGDADPTVRTYRSEIFAEPHHH